MAVSVTISLGPRAEHARWLEECIRSVANQTEKPSDVLLVDDMHGLSAEKRDWYESLLYPVPFRVWDAPWNLGCIGSVNCGVALAQSECVVLLASDDMLGPHAIERCEKAWAHWGIDGYYWFDCHMINEAGEPDVEPDQSTMCGPAMVTKGLWKATGGYPPESVVGHSDTILLNIFVHNNLGPIISIEGGLSDPSYIARMHPQADHSQRWDKGWADIIYRTRDLMPLIWQKPEWGRYA